MSDIPPPVLQPLMRECSCCHRQFPSNHVMQMDNRWICVECKPRVVQEFAESGRIGGATVARYGKQLVMSRDAQLPDRCVKCNSAEGVTRLQRNLYWHHPAIYLCLLLNILIYAIVAMCVRKRATISVGLCSVHRKRRRIGIAVGWLSLLFCILTVMALGFGVSGWFAIFGVFVLLAGVITGAVMSTPVTPAKIDAEFIWLKGVDAKFLADLPLWRG